MTRIAIVGFGFMGQLHAQVYRLLENATVAGVADQHAESARDRLAGLGLEAPVFGSLAELMASVDCDAVDICLPTDLHRALVLEAAAAGKHVFCEKPISTTREAAEEMIAATREAKVSLMVGHCIRFWPEYQAIYDFIRAGTGGRLLSLNLQRFGGRPSYTVDNWIADEGRCRGAALDMHIHDTDCLHHFLGPPRGVTSRGIREEAGWNYISTLYDYENVVVSAEGGWLLPPKWGFRMTLKAVFEEAAIDFDSSRDPTLTLTLGGDDPAPMPFPALPTTGSAPSGGNISDLGGYYNELAYFVSRLEAGEAIGINTGEDALASLRCVLAEIESATTGQPVLLT